MVESGPYKEVSLNVKPKRGVAVVGDNGAGKSTLTKILAGAVRPDSGSLRLKAVPSLSITPKDARRLGIEMLQQDLALVADFNATENLFFGRELSIAGFCGPVKCLPHARRFKRTGSVPPGSQSTGAVSLGWPTSSRGNRPGFSLGEQIDYSG